MSELASRLTSPVVRRTRAEPATGTALYEVTVTHVRHERLRREFTHRGYLWLVDLDRLPTLPWWQRPFARFDPRDHLGSGGSIRDNLDAWLRGQGVDLRGGQVLMLAGARVLGYVFNPLTVYWCHRPDGELACVVAEVHNTYGERHCYLLHPDQAGRAGTDKKFYVSPFLPMDGEYVMKLPRPDQRLSLAVIMRRNGATMLTARVTGVRRAATPAALVRLLLRFPLAPHRVSLLIRRHGIALWLRRIPVIPRPRHEPQEGVQ